MRHASLFLASLLLFEALVAVPALAPLMMLYLPIRAAALAYRTYRIAARMNALTRRLMLTSQLFRLVLNRQENRLLGLFGLVKDSCLRRFFCELKQGRHHRRRKRHLQLQAADYSSHLKHEKRIAITVSFSNPTNGGFCERRFKSCPYDSQDMLQALKKLSTVWKDLKIPSKVNTIFSGEKLDNTNERR